MIDLIERLRGCAETLEGEYRPFAASYVHEAIDRLAKAEALAVALENLDKFVWSLGYSRAVPEVDAAFRAHTAWRQP